MPQDPRSLQKMKTIKQFFMFAGVGAIGTIIHFTALIFLVSFDWNRVLATTVGAILGAVTNYMLNYHFTFKSKQSHFSTSVKFFLIALVGIGINAIVFSALLFMHYLVAQIFTTIIVLFWNFLANRLWTFRGS